MNGWRFDLLRPPRVGSDFGPGERNPDVSAILAMLAGLVARSKGLEIEEGIKAALKEKGEARVERNMSATWKRNHQYCHMIASHP